jgi:DNA-binding MarR family transcriptional regulator
VLEAAHSRAGHLIRRTYQISQALFLSETAELGLTSVQYSALNAIVQLPDLDQASLSGVIALDKTTLVKVLDRLVAKDLITRVRSTTDRRCHVLNATAKGKKIIAEIGPMLDRIQERLLAPLSPDEKLVQVNNIYSRVPLDHEIYDGVLLRAQASKAAAIAESA